MKMIQKVGVIAAVMMLSLGAARAEKAPVAAANEASHTISLPDNLKPDAVIGAVSKAFTEVGWSNVAVNKDVVTATLDRHDIKVSATAVCSASQVKLAATFEPGPNTPEKARASVHRWLRSVDRNSKTELGLSPKPAKKDKKAEAEK